jgi:hypothetical protein
MFVIASLSSLSSVDTDGLGGSRHGGTSESGIWPALIIDTTDDATVVAAADISSWSCLWFRLNAKSGAYCDNEKSFNNAGLNHF